LLVAAAQLVSPQSTAIPGLSARPITGDPRLAGNTNLHEAYDPHGFLRTDEMRLSGYQFWLNVQERIPLGPVGHLSNNPVAEKGTELHGARSFFIYDVSYSEAGLAHPRELAVVTHYTDRIRHAGGSTGRMAPSERRISSVTSRSAGSDTVVASTRAGPLLRPPAHAGSWSRQCVPLFRKAKRWTTSCRRSAVRSSGRLPLKVALIMTRVPLADPSGRNKRTPGPRPPL
jgi:hypothetical protein